MSKSKGNTLDPIDILDGITPEALLEKSLKGLLLGTHAEQVEKRVRKNFPTGIGRYGADALRFTLCAQASFAQTLNFDMNRCEGYRNFCNKLWNASRFVLMNCAGKTIETHVRQSDLGLAERWILSRLQRTVAEVERGFLTYRFDLAAAAIYQFAWDEYCDWYLELAKVATQSEDQPAQATTLGVLVQVLETILRLAHPVIPFITEELWHKVAPLARGAELPESEFLMTQPYPNVDEALIDTAAEAWAESLKAKVDAVRALRSEMNLSPAQRVPLLVACETSEMRAAAERDAPYLKLLGKLSEVKVVADLPRDALAAVQVVSDARLMLVVEVDRAAELIRLDKEIQQVEGKIGGLASRLDKPEFVSKAPPQVISQQRIQLEQLRRNLDQLQQQRGRLSN